MAEVKKKPAPKPAGLDSTDTLLWVIMIVAVIIFLFIGTGDLYGPALSGDNILSKIKILFAFIFSKQLWYVIGIIETIFAIFFIAVIVFSAIRMREIQLHEKEEIEHEIALAQARDKENEKNQNPRWIYVLGLVESNSPSDWRVAIIEADSILDDIMNEKGFSGDSLGERLTSARTSGGFINVENAWEGHNLRNKIAHDGANFPISQMEARRAIRLYELCFEEFGIL